MAFSNFMQAGLHQLLQQSININAIANNAENLSKLGEKLYRHFCSPAQHLLPAYRQSYQQTLCALRLALNPPLIPLQSKIVKDFQEDIKRGFLPVFQRTHLYKSLAKECKTLEQYVLFNQENVHVGTKQVFEANLASLIGETQLPNLTDLILSDVQQNIEISQDLLQLLKTHDLLASGIWHFLRADKTLSILISALQQEQTFQRVIKIDQNVEDILTLVRNFHRFAEHALNDYADSASLQTLANAQQHLKQDTQRPYLLGLTQAFRNPNFSQAKQLMETALQQAQTNEEKALIHYSLFKLLVSSRQTELSTAFKHLKTAINLDEQHYAPCDPLSFELEDLLGVGGMGYALLATSGRERLVIKCFWQDLQEKQLDEALKMQQIATDYVPSLFGKGIYRYQQRLCLITKYLPTAIDGAKWLQKYGKLEEPIGIVIAIRLAKALQAIHQAGILHLDLKPANVLLLPADLIEDWQVRVIDFGLSKLLPQLNTAGHTRTLTGTVSQFVTASFDYASPEQKAGLKTTIASDVYSYGKTMFELLGDIGGFDIPDLLQAPLKKCLKIKPEERINLDDLLIELNQLNGDDSKVNRTSSPLRTASPSEVENIDKEREELERQRREHDKKIQEDQARLAKEREELERKRQEQERLEQERKQREELERQHREQQWLAKEKGVPRTFTTMKAGKQVECTVYEKTFDINGVPLVMVYIPAGTFMMGDNQWDRTKPVHEVEIKKLFYMGKYPITQIQYQAVMNDNPSNWKGNYLPVESLYWKQAKEFCEKLSNLLKQKFDLPSEAQWEYACRAETTTNYWWGDQMDNNRCWYWDNVDKRTHPINEQESTHINPFGLCDMHGNVWEWCEDVWHDNYSGAPSDGSAWTQGNSTSHLLRGGSWYFNAVNCRSAYRNNYSSRGINFGFRVALLPLPQDSL